MSRKRSGYLTPASSSKRRRTMSSSTKVVKRQPGSSVIRSAGGRFVVNTLANLAANTSPTVAAAVRAARVGRALGGVAKNLYGRFKKASKPKRGARVYSSRDAGFFNRRIKNYTTLDKCADHGFVQKLEYNNSFNTNRQVAYVAQSTMPGGLVTRAVTKSMLKKLFNQANFTIKSELEVILKNSYYSGRIILYYKLRDGEQELNITLNVIKEVSTLESLCEDYMVQINGTGIENAFQWLRMQFVMDYSGAFTALDIRSEIDLTSARIVLVSRSFLKVQNRSIQSAGNNEADDVDNVPIYGKSFEYKTNGTVYRDYYKNPTDTTSRLTTNPLTGCLPAPSTEVTSQEKWYAEVPMSSQIVGCYKTMGVKLQPGDIKTSVMRDYVEMGYNEFFNKVVRVKDLQRSDGRFSQYWIGKTRLFGFEKMINQVATADNEIKIAFEHQINVGAIFKVRKILHTAPSIKIKTDGPNTAAW